MNLRRLTAVLLRYLYVLKGNPQRLFNIVIWPVTDVVVWGFITKYLNGVGVSGFNFTTVFLGAVILWAFMIRAQQGISTPALEDIWSHNLLNYFASPLSTGEYIVGLVLASVLSSAIGIMLIAIIAWAAFSYSIFTMGALLLPYLFVLFLFGFALGIFAIAMIIRFGPSAEWFIWPIPSLIEPFCGVFYPISVLPHWMQAVSLVLPPAYVFQGMRGVLLDGSFSWANLSIGAGLSLLYIVAAYVFFRFVFRYAIKNGLIARFDAEGS